MKKLITSFFILSLFLAEPVLANITPNDFYYGNQWYLSKIKADSAWDKITGSPDMVIAVIDSGIQVNHPDLKDNIWKNAREIFGNNIDDDGNGFIDDVSGWDFVNNAPDPSPKFTVGWTEAGVSHGTMVAGIIAARGNNSEGVAGITWQAQIMALKVLNDKGEGKLSNVIRAIDYAIANGADIINLSFVSFTYSDGMQEAIRRAHKAGIMIVAAAGNEQADGVGYDIEKTPIYPACYDGELIGENMVIGVAATDALDQKAKFSSYGSRCVDLVAPGISFFSAVTAGSVVDFSNKLYDGYWSGTSMAAPQVTATLALIAQANSELSRREIVNILFASTDNISRLNPDYAGQLGNGRLNVNRAVEMAKEKLYSRVGRIVVLPQSSAKSKQPKLTAATGDLADKLPLDIKGGESVAIGDVNGDGLEEIVIGAGTSGEPKIMIYSESGRLIKQILAYDKYFRGGVSVALVDINGDEQMEIAAAQAARGTGQVKIFNYSGQLKKQFLVDSRYWRGGLNLAAGDIDGNGDQEIVAAYGAGSEPMIKMFHTDGKILGAFLAYEKKFRGGVKVAVANLNGRKNHNQADIIVSPGKGRDPQIKIFDNHGIMTRQFLAYSRNWQGGVNLSAGDLNNDGLPEIATAAQAGAAPHVRVFSARGELMESFYAWEENWNGGVNIGIIKISN
ncbi:MAG: S8 family serine peptidase [Patescibacteria group bacterium]|jgi:hypothetical protein